MASEEPAPEQQLAQSGPQDGGADSESYWSSALQQHEAEEQSTFSATHRPSWGQALAGYRDTRSARKVYINPDGTFDPLNDPSDELGPMPTYMHARPTFFQKVMHDPIYIPLMLGMAGSLGRGVYERVRGMPLNSSTFMIMRVFFGGAVMATYCYSKARDTGKLLPWVHPKPWDI